MSEWDDFRPDGVSTPLEHKPEPSMTPIPPIPEDRGCPRCSIGTNIFKGSCIVCCHLNDSIAALLKQMAERIAKLTAEVGRLTKTNSLLQECQANHNWWVKRAGELEAENTRLKAPVTAGTAEYMAAPYRSIAAREFFNFVIRSRAAIKEGQ